MNEEALVKKVCGEYLRKNPEYLRKDKEYQRFDTCCYENTTNLVYFNGYLVYCIEDTKIFNIGECWSCVAEGLIPLVQQRIVYIASPFYLYSERFLLNSRVLKLKLYDCECDYLGSTIYRYNVLTRLYIVLREKVCPDVARLLVEKMYYQ